MGLSHILRVLSAECEYEMLKGQSNSYKTPAAQSDSSGWDTTLRH